MKEMAFKKGHFLIFFKWVCKRLIPTHDASRLHDYYVAPGKHLKIFIKALDEIKFSVLLAVIFVRHVF